MKIPIVSSHEHGCGLSMNTTDFEVIGIDRPAGEGGRDVYQVELRVPEDLIYFSGHFPNDPVLPGVVQLNNIILAYTSEFWPELGYLQRVRRLKYIQAIRPGEMIQLRLGRRSAPRQVSAAIYRGESCCTSGILIFAGRESDD